MHCTLIYRAGGLSSEQLNLIDHTDDHGADGACAPLPDDLPGAAAFIQHHHDISDPGLHIIETNIISAGFAAIEVQAGNQQQLVTAVESVLDGAGNGSFDSPDVHGH